MLGQLNPSRVPQGCGNAALPGFVVFLLVAEKNPYWQASVIMRNEL
jgi:hypothetical protein